MPGTPPHDPTAAHVVIEEPSCLYHLLRICRPAPLPPTGRALRLHECHGWSEAPRPARAQNAVDDVRLANPLARQERMGTGWFAVIMEYEGLVCGRPRLQGHHQC